MPARARAERVAPARVGQVEVAHRARDADVGEPALLLDVALVDRARVREDAVLAADDEDDRELEALGVVQRHQRHEALVVADRVGVGEQRDLLQELADGAARRWRVVLARDRARAPRGSRSGPAPRSCARPPARRGSPSRAGSPRAARRPRRPLSTRSRRRSIVAHEAPERLDAPRFPSPGTFAASAAASHGRDPDRVGVREHARQRRLPDPAPRRVGDPRERPAVLRVDQEGQVGDRVLDLRALVELRAADDLVADLRAHEHVLEHPRLRVGPVEDRDLRAR